MKVKIVKCSKDYYWYKDRIGEVFDIRDYRFDNDCYEVKGSYEGICKVDTIPVNEIKYESRDMTLETKCPAGFSQMVGSIVCCNCTYNCESDLINRVVLCSWQKEEEDKMDLKSIAVRFENVEQRKEIELAFKNNGFHITEGLVEYRNGIIGYIESGKYVSILTEYGMMGKKIISYEEFIGGNEMKRLDVRKEYKDSNILVVPKTYEDDYLLISTYLNKHETTTIRVGKDYLTSLTKVNAMLKTMELPYELYESVGWNKVEEDTEITWEEECIVYKAPNGILRRLGKFVKYIPDIKKLVVRTGDEVYIVDEDKVELNK